MRGVIKKWISTQLKGSAIIKGAPAVFTSIVVILFSPLLIIATFCWSIFGDNESVPEFMFLFCFLYFGIAWLIRLLLIKKSNKPI